MHEITGFTAGLIPNAAWTRFRNTAASDMDGLRVHPQGFLESRAGHTWIFHDEPVEDFFIYKNLVIAIIDSNLRWGRLNNNQIGVVFSDFDPVINLNATKGWSFTVLDNATGEYIFMGNGTGELTGGLGGVYVIDLTDVFAHEQPQAPTAYHFYLNKPTISSVTIVDPGRSGESRLEKRPIAFRVQVVQTLNDVPIAVSEPSEPILLSGFNTLRADQSAADIPSGTEVRTRYRVQFNLPSRGIANKMYIYRAERNHDGGLVSLFRRVGIVDYPTLDTQTGSQFEGLMEITDDGFSTSDHIIPDAGEKVAWKYIETDGVRSYAVPENSDRLYFSYFDGISERLYRNFSDELAIPTDGEPITGLKFLRRNYLVVYTARRIILIRTDPIASRCTVVDQIPTESNDSSIGCYAPRSLVNHSGYHFFVASDKRVYRYGGQNVRWIGDKIEPLLVPLDVEIPDNVLFTPANIHGAIHEGLYYLSYPNLHEPPANAIYWRNQTVSWRDNGLDWKPSLSPHAPNTTLIYDIERERWYKDQFGVSTFAKDSFDRLYGIIRKSVFRMYDDPDMAVPWRWKSNKFILPQYMLLFNVFVYSQTEADITVTLRTEQGEETQSLVVEDAFDYFSQYAGFSLWGRTAEIEIEGYGPVTIDRIVLNEEIE